MTTHLLSRLALAAAALLIITAVLAGLRQDRPRAAAHQLPFRYDFSSEGRLQEAATAEESSSPFWWLNSGAYFTLWNGHGSTVQHELLESDQWRRIYASTDPGETDDGARPQNIFRLLTKGMWEDAAQETEVRINRYHVSKDPHRGESNGVLLFSRYRDEEMLYYAGLRVDGNAVIKKKRGGAYFTLALEPYLAGDYHRAERPNLLPVGSWIGLRLETKTLDDGRVSLRLYADIGRTGHWTLAASAVDDGTLGGPALTETGRGGIRTDFMDVDIDSYRADPLALMTQRT